MLIDWFTAGAQIVNFLILVWLMKRFLYKPILRAIDARDGKIAARLSEAETKEKEASAQLAFYQAKLRDLEEQQADIMARTKAEAERQHAEMIEQARERVRSLETKWREDLDRERHSFLMNLRRRATAEILAIARRTVADLASVDVQRCAIQVFLEKIRALDDEAWKNFAQGDLLIRSAFDVPEDKRAEIRQTIEDRLGAPVNLRFEHAAGMGLGLELRGNGWRIGWNSESYLETLEEALREILEHSGRPVGGNPRKAA
jgi:F-type H+-transporting ATPase subunit b